MIKNEKTSAARLSVYSNSALIVMMVAVGLVTGSVSVLSEAAHSVVDLMASFIALFAVREASRPPDKRHPYGHGKVENVSATIEAILIIVAAAFILYEAMERLIHGAEVRRIGWGIAVMAVSSILNYVVARKIYKVARKTGSPALEADAAHLSAHVYSSAGVFAGLILIPIFDAPIIDPIVAMGIGAYIVWMGARMTKNSVRSLLDETLPEEDLARIKQIIEETSKAQGFHRLRARTAGSYKEIDLHLEVNPQMTVQESHDITILLEEKIQSEFPGANVVIHVEPAGRILVDPEIDHV